MPGAECIDREETAVGLQGVPATAVIETVDIRGHNTVCYLQQSGHNTVSKQQEITAFVVS